MILKAVAPLARNRIRPLGEFERTLDPAGPFPF